MHEKVTGRDRLDGQARAGNSVDGSVHVMGHWHIRAFDPDGNLIHEDEIHNIVVNEGLDHLLDVTLSAATQTATWYVGLTDGNPTTDPTDTLSSHAGWTEVTAYDETNRPEWVDGGVSSQSVDNSGSTATYTINSGSTTIGGAFLASDNTKGGTTGILYSVGAFSGSDVTLSSGSTLEVTATFTTSAA